MYYFILFLSLFFIVRLHGKADAKENLLFRTGSTNCRWQNFNILNARARAFVCKSERARMCGSEFLNFRLYRKYTVAKWRIYIFRTIHRSFAWVGLSRGSCTILHLPLVWIEYFDTSVWCWRGIFFLYFYLQFMRKTPKILQICRLIVLQRCYHQIVHLLRAKEMNAILITNEIV